GACPAGQEEVAAVGHPGAGQWGSDTDLRRPPDERLLGGRLEAMVAVGQGRDGVHQAAGDLSGQWPEELGAPDAVAEEDGGVGRLEWAGDKAGILPTVSQQVQPDRALLGCAGAEVGRGAAERPEGDPATGATDDLAGAPPGGKEAAGRLPRRGASEPGTDEALRGAPPAVPDPPQVR